MTWLHLHLRPGECRIAPRQCGDDDACYLSHHFVAERFFRVFELNPAACAQLKLLDPTIAIRDPAGWISLLSNARSTYA
jgi:hypothetical protein